MAGVRLSGIDSFPRESPIPVFGKREADVSRTFSSLSFLFPVSFLFASRVGTDLERLEMNAASSLRVCAFNLQPLRHDFNRRACFNFAGRDFERH